MKRDNHLDHIAPRIIGIGLVILLGTSCTPKDAGEPGGVGATSGNSPLPAPLVEGDRTGGTTGTSHGMPTGGRSAGGDVSGGPTSDARGPGVPTPAGPEEKDP